MDVGRRCEGVVGMEGIWCELDGMSMVLERLERECDQTRAVFWVEVTSGTETVVSLRSKRPDRGCDETRGSSKLTVYSLRHFGFETEEVDDGK
jgi:hypothetical protein